MSDDNNDMFYCSFVSIHYIICECGETFPSEEALRAHLEKEHPHKRERKEYKCGVCDAVFTTEEACIGHYEEAHIEREEVPESLEVQEYQEDVKNVPMVFQPVKKVREKKRKSFYSRNIVCEVCGKRYASNAALRYHQRVHTGERPYQCSECPKTFTMPLFLQIHVRTHTGERPYECVHCPKAFSNKAALLRHDRVHTGVKPYECPQCGKFFTQSNSMKLHVNTVHLKMPAPYKSKTRKLKAQEREMMKKNTQNVYKVSEEPAQPDILVKEEYVYEEVEETQVLYDEDEQKEISYEVVYEQEEA